jgi:hypothetical protein
LNQAKTPVRRRSGIVSESAACSTARNGPISLPLGLMTPIVAATTRTGSQLEPAKPTPAKAMRTDPTINTRRRPTRSACVVSQSVIAASPRSVSVSSRPIS